MLKYPRRIMWRRRWIHHGSWTFLTDDEISKASNSMTLSGKITDIREFLSLLKLRPLPNLHPSSFMQTKPRMGTLTWITEVLHHRPGRHQFSTIHPNYTNRNRIEHWYQASRHQTCGTSLCKKYQRLLFTAPRSSSSTVGWTFLLKLLKHSIKIETPLTSFRIFIHHLSGRTQKIWTGQTKKISKHRRRNVKH